jgi:hypothetical protein
MELLSRKCRLFLHARLPYLPQPSQMHTSLFWIFPSVRRWIPLSQTSRVLTMTRVYCSSCNRWFGGAQYFSLHLRSESNSVCAEAFDRSEASRNRVQGSRETSNASRKRTIQQVEAVLRRNEGPLRARMRTVAKSTVYLTCIMPMQTLTGLT